MKHQHAIRNWLKTYWLALLLGGGFILSGLVWIQPMQPDKVYIYQIGHRVEVSQILLGFLSLPLGEIYSRVIFSNPNSESLAYPVVYLLSDAIDRPIATIIIITSGILIGVCVWILLRITRIQKLVRRLLFINFAFGLGIGFLFVLSSIPFEYTQKSSCEVPISESTALRVQYFDSKREQDRELAGIPIHREISYQITQDGGSTWREFVHIGFSWGDCNQIRIHNEQFFWFWESGALFITHDGGETWHLWSIQELVGEFANIPADSQIEVVNFSDDLNGHMQITYFDRDTQTQPTSTLISTNGGYTWNIQ